MTSRQTMLQEVVAKMDFGLTEVQRWWSRTRRFLRWPNRICVWAGGFGPRLLFASRHKGTTTT